MTTTHTRPRPFDGMAARGPLLASPLLVSVLLAFLMLLSAPAAAQRVVSTRIVENAFGPAVIGLIENDTDRSVDVASVRVRLLDANGDAVAEQTGVPDLRVLAPGDRSPFTVPSFDPVPSSSVSTASVDLTVRPAEAPPEDLVVRDLNAEPSTTGTRVTGTVVNLGDAPRTFIKVSATALGANDEVLGTSAQYENVRTLAAGDSMAFTVFLPRLLETPEVWLVRAYDGRTP